MVRFIGQKKYHRPHLPPGILPELVHGYRDEVDQAEGTDEDDVNRQSCGTAHQGSDQHGGEAVAAIFDGAGGHDRGDGACEAGQEGDETLAVQADLGHEPVHDKRHAGHVAAVFQ